MSNAKLSRAEACSLVSEMEGDIHPIAGMAHAITIIADRIAEHDSPANEALWMLSFVMHQQAKTLLGYHAKLFSGLRGDEPDTTA